MEGQDNRQADVGGRPTKYRKAFDRQAYQLALLGATDAQLSEVFDITVSTLYEWKKRYRGFSEALRRGKTQADAEVAAGLFKRATGFLFDEVTFERLEIGEAPAADDPEAAAEVKQPVYRRKVVTKYVAPDTGAAMSWLKNRQKELWRDRQEIGLDFDNMPDDQVDRLWEKALAMASKNSHDGQ